MCLHLENLVDSFDGYGCEKINVGYYFILCCFCPIIRVQCVGWKLHED